MGMNVGQEGGDEDEVNSSINTTPLVDVMLVLLIIFLITIPVVLHDVAVDLPKESNQPRKTRPENITISVNKEGDVFWGQTLITDNEQLVDRLKKEAVKDPQPGVASVCRLPGCRRRARPMRSSCASSHSMARNSIPPC